ncbi:MAG TPA: HEAT repeat domain-containing protein [Candidatus Methylomirabilis sp.]|nr:HEAT repeat domain-containing protein [Candidatus Methylomirabilis sp.]
MSEQQVQKVSAPKPGRLLAADARLGTALRYTVLLAALGSISILAGFETARRTVPQPAPDSTARPQTNSAALRPAGMPSSEKNVDAEISRLAPQEQAARLLQRALDGDEASLNVLREKADGWRGRLQNTDRLFDLVLAALNSHDLRVRTAAVDLDLAANNLSKSPESVSRLLAQLQRDPSERGMALWRLGSLGNRGVQPDRVLESLVKYAHDRNEHTRYWAVEGLAMLGIDAAVDPLLDRLAHDPSTRVRERAASGLGQSGLLTREERLAAVPDLLNLTDDDSLGTTTRELVYGTLRVITGAALGNDANAWRAWWANHDPANEKPKRATHLLQA